MGFILFFLFLFGLLVGSFLNVLIDRLPKEQSVVFPNSYCDHCKRRLAWYDLVPVFSFIVLIGKCRNCYSPISWQYPLVEILTGLFFVVTFLSLPSGDLASIIYYLAFESILIAIFFADLKYGIIPDLLVFCGIIVSLLYHLLTHYQLLITNYFFSALGSFLFFLAIYLLTKGRGMGFGDVKLSFLLGLFFGFPKIIFVLYIAFLTGAVFSIILIVLGKKKLKETIVFGPFLVLASFLVLFFYRYLQALWFLPT